jgi:L-serine deaminase
MTTGSARVDPKPTSTAAGHGLLTALTLTAMGRLPKVLLAIKSADRRDSAPLAGVAELVDATASKAALHKEV